MESIAVVGASLAGLNAADALRAEGFAGRLVVIGEEPHRPYDRPPLSKQVLRGEWAPERALLPLGSEVAGIDWRLGRRAVGFDSEALEVALDDGSRERFDGIVIATGARPGTLAGDRLAGVHVLRTLDDSRELAASLAGAPARVAVIGAGFIGAEVAASCRGMGIAVTIVEAMAAPFEPVLGTELGARLAAIHREEGVELRAGVGVTRLEGDADGRVRTVHLSDRSTVEASVVVVGIGVEPCTDWLRGSGLSLVGGVRCDDACGVAPGVVAAGDVACFRAPRHHRARRVEHWDNAVRQGRHAARRLLAEREGAVGPAYDPVPWFWSDQYDFKLQLVGSTDGQEEVELVRDEPDARRVLALYRRGDRLLGAAGIGVARDIVAARRLLVSGASWSEAVATIVAEGWR
jgi:NADPH-dependent 2,4-dienoyl-CoA reductase/sulfur reductase-like enzyme